MDDNKILITFEMANNHMGDLEHGFKIVDELKVISDKYPQFDYSVKLQYRDDSFFHKDHIDRRDHKLIKRFTETRLGEDGFLKLIDHIRKKNFITMCTPWDEKAVQFLENSNIEIMKIASCSFNDWDLLERVSLCKQPIIASTAGAKKIDIDKVYSLFKNKNKKFSLMHCVGEYPTKDEDLQLNQIDFLKKNYPECKIGFSTHENPDNLTSAKLALAKDAKIFEKHVGVPDSDKKYVLNPYSANPQQIEKWLNSMEDATKMCSDKLFIAANNIIGNKKIKFSVVRYGNVAGSRGSVIPVFLKQKKNNCLEITHRSMTRFNITLNESIEMVLWSIINNIGGEIFIPKIPSYNILDLAKAICPSCKIKFTGILVANHGPFCWGKNVIDALQNLERLEFIAELAYKTKLLNKKKNLVSEQLVKKHYDRKHGIHAYYGQRNK